MVELCELCILPQFGPKKMTQEKLAMFTKILNYTKSPCIIFYAKIPQYSYYIYCLHEESTHFSGRVSASFGLEVLVQFGI